MYISWHQGPSAGMKDLGFVGEPGEQLVTQGCPAGHPVPAWREASEVGPWVEQVCIWGETLTAEVWGPPVHTDALVQTGLGIGSHRIAHTFTVSAHVTPTGITHAGLIVGQVVYLWRGEVSCWHYSGSRLELDFVALGYMYWGSALAL